MERTQPANGDTVRAALSVVSVRFSRPVNASLTTLTLLRDGAAVPAPAVRMVDSAGHEFALDTGPLAAGSYVARWRTAGADGHVLNGSFTFVVQAEPATALPADTAVAADTANPDAAAASATAAPGTPPAEVAGAVTAAEPGSTGVSSSEADSPLAVAMRWVWFVALLGMIGVPAFRFGVLMRIARDPAHLATAARAELGLGFIALAAASLSVVALCGRLLLQASALGLTEQGWSGASLDRLLLGTGWGLAWVLQAIATLAFAAGMLIVRAPYGRAAGWMGAGGSVILLSAVPALSGHAAAVERVTGIAILADALHVLGAGVWLGSLAMLLAVGVPAAFAGGGDAEGSVAAMARAFSRMALVAASTVAVTGVISSLFHIDHGADLWGTTWGRVLLLKVAILIGVAALGSHNWKKVVPAMGGADGTRRLQRSSRAELGLAALVLLVTAILVALPTP
ncbi:CopD family protein [Longimicrobium terrae]|uniref:Putative copper export protein/methionine-rich copper-binding protein CopC n=1 Tax=Longimicrobium terrae TaxID=1639882 RepID=A0A841H6S1_9BACT|nr:putative copper export protein/methionine-rich copper-binding protein CopC [Longimicrobium terrae]MBB6073602.1 putative copper export protein/methionine-rich copper-binding protein CopC [Longimicrobium terrae]NNC29391.1 copper resistance protein CopC/CopD [Longimicrobium terrae]